MLSGHLLHLHPNACVFIVLHWTSPNCTLLYCSALYCAVMYCTVLKLYCTVLYCTGLYCNEYNYSITIVHCTVLHYTPPPMPRCYICRHPEGRLLGISDVWHRAKTLMMPHPELSCTKLYLTSLYITCFWWILLHFPVMETMQFKNLLHYSLLYFQVLPLTSL